MPAERFILIPGMGADERLFGPQRAYGFDFEVPRMPIPGPGDDMTAYAARVRDLLALDGPCVVGGVSFGGMLACELAALCHARCALLIASCRSRAAIPRYYWLAERVSRFLPDGLIRRRCIASSRILARLESLNHQQYRLIRDMSVDVPVLFLRRVGRMILRWDGTSLPSCPRYQIHGQIDRVIPLKGNEPDEIVADGGHLINLTHAEQVNRFLERHVDGSG